MSIPMLELKDLNCSFIKFGKLFFLEDKENLTVLTSLSPLESMNIIINRFLNTNIIKKARKKDLIKMLG